jgi:RimJ/RimL family protein N-acetyltransferase
MPSFNWPAGQPTLGGRSEPECLRPWAERDIGSVFSACQDPDIQRWTTVPVPYLKDHARGFVSDMAPTEWLARNGSHFCIASSDDDRVLGACGLVTMDPDLSTAQLGYWLAPAGRGAGTASRAVTLLAGWAFPEVGLHRLELHIEVGNESSQAVARRVGCVREQPQLWTLSP